MTERRSGDRWIAVLGGRRERWGGERRRRQIFRRLAERTDAQIVTGWSWESIKPAFAGGGVRIPLLGRRGPLPRLVSGETLDADVIDQLRRRADLTAVAIYDDPVPHRAALGVPASEDEARELVARRDANVSAFRWKVMPTMALGELAGIPLDSVIAGENGTDTRRIVTGTWPEDPAIGFNSGAAPGRGIEELIEAARLLRAEFSTLRLLLWLVPTGPESAAYLSGIRESVRRDRWVQVDQLSVDDFSAAYRQATVFCIPHPADIYWDSTLPVKIFDALAAGRPLVVTPRTETVRLVERHGVGVAAAGDRPEELADAIRPLLADEAEARRIGATARRVAEERYDWPKVGDRIATAILEREGLLPSGRG